MGCTACCPSRGCSIAAQNLQKCVVNLPLHAACHRSALWQKCSGCWWQSMVSSRRQAMAT
jgi:hypothetical protein